MKINYDADVDVLMIRLRAGDYAESDEVAPNIIIDFDDQGLPLTIEILDARRLLGTANALTLELPLTVAVE